MTENSKTAQWFKENSNLQQSLVFDFKKKKKKKKQGSCWMLLGYSAFMEFSTGLYVFRSHTQ